MLKSLHVENFTVFQKADLTFGKNLNIIIGENGSGKSHLLKAIYVPLAVSAAPAKNGGADTPGKSQLAQALAQKLVGVFRPEGLGRLVRRKVGRGKSLLSYKFDKPELDLEFSFSTLAKQEVTITKRPAAAVDKLPVFLPTRELLTIYPGFVSLYETTDLSFEETWRDTCLLLGASLARGPRESKIRELLVPLEHAMGGKVDFPEAKRFYLNLASGNMEMHLVAEGLRKLATVARLVATGSLLDKGYLFWDEPESNLNPKIIKTIARTILLLADSGIQVFIATHSLFLMRELHILQQRDFSSVDSRCFGLHIGEAGAVSVRQGKAMDEVGDIAALDEDLQQSERYVDTEMGVEMIHA